MDRGLISRKERGSYKKLPRVDRYLDLLTRVKSNRDRWIEIERLRGDAVARAAALAAGDEAGRRRLIDGLAAGGSGRLRRCGRRWESPAANGAAAWAPAASRPRRGLTGVSR